MSPPGFSRRETFAASLAALGVAADPVEGRPAPSLELAPRPTRVFKIADRSHEDTETWIFSLLAQTATPAKLKPVSMRIDLLKDASLLRTTTYPNPGFTPLTYQTAAPRRLADGSEPPRPIYWPFAIRIRATEPRSLGANAMHVEVEAIDEVKGRRRGVAFLRIETYSQRTELTFPFRGKGIILQGGAANGGHRNRSGQFAFDALGLDEAWSIIAPGDGKKNEDYRGWGRELLAPADGLVVRSRGDRPEQPVADVSDPKYYAPQYPAGGDPGNHLIIDHGGAEYSMIAHFRSGSMTVKTGDKVRRGQVLGKLGHSGDTDGPHVHYQLQSGPDWEFADGLPCKFSNVSEPFLDRGIYFEAT